MAFLNKIWNFLKKLSKQQGFYFCLIFTILNIVMTKQILNNNGVHHFGLIVLAEIVFEIIFIFIVVYGTKKHWKIEKQFLVSAIILGLGFLVLLPPGMSPDDANHFKRAYGIASGAFFSSTVDDGTKVGSELPKGIEESLVMNPHRGMYGELKDKVLAGVSEENVMESYPNTAIYNFLCYLPQSLAALIGKIFNMSLLATAYLMEIFNFAVFVLLIYFAIKLIPKFKSIILFIALNPMTLQEATSLSLDGLAIGLSIFLVAYVCYLKYGREKVMSWKELTILYVLAIVIGLCKMVYAPLILLYFLIPYERFGTKKKKWIHASIMAVLFLAVNALWLMATSGLLTNFKEGVNAGEQMMVVVKDPLGYVIKMAATTNQQAIDWFMGILGLSLGAFNLNLPNIYFFVALIFAVILFAQRHERLSLKTVDRWVFWVTFLSIVFLIFTSVYMQWTEVGGSIIDGVQGRYFLPILILIPILICRKNDKEPHMNLITENTVLYFSLFMNVAAFVVFFANNI